MMSSVSFPVMVKGEVNSPVTKHEPGGIGDVPANGFGTVVAPLGVYPVVTCPIVSNPQYP